MQQYTPVEVLKSQCDRDFEVDVDFYMVDVGMSYPCLGPARIFAPVWVSKYTTDYIRTYITMQKKGFGRYFCDYLESFTSSPGLLRLIHIRLYNHMGPCIAMCRDVSSAMSMLYQLS